MNKSEFIRQLRLELDFLNKEDREDVIKYYDELIQDAVDNGKNEADFIAGLGSFDEIIKNIKQDRTFMEKVKTINITPEVKNGLGIAAKVIGYIVFVIFSIVIISIGISFIVSGGSAGTLAIFNLVTSLISETTTLSVFSIIGRIGTAIFGAGLLIIGIWLIWWYATWAKKSLDKLFSWLQEAFGDKGGKSNV